MSREWGDVERMIATDLGPVDEEKQENRAIQNEFTALLLCPRETNDDRAVFVELLNIFIKKYKSTLQVQPLPEFGAIIPKKLVIKISEVEKVIQFLTLEPAPKDPKVKQSPQWFDKPKARA